MAPRRRWNQFNKGVMSSPQPEAIQNATTLHDDMTALLRDGTYSDVTICCKDIEFKVHKAILAPRCAWFRACLDSGYKEGEQGIIRLDDDDPDAFRMALRELYTRSDSVVWDAFAENKHYDLFVLIHTWKLADKYDMRNLSQQCLTFLSTDEGIKILKRRAPDLDAWFACLMTALIESDGLGEEGHCGSNGNENTQIKDHNRTMRSTIKRQILLSKDMSVMSTEDRDILRSHPDLAVELFTYACQNSVIKPDTSTAATGAGVTVGPPAKVIDLDAVPEGNFWVAGHGWS